MRILQRLAFAVLLAAGLPLAAATLEGRPAPEMSLRGADGQQRTLAELANGRPTVVLFWASWCPYCEALMPHLQKLLDRHAGKVAVVAIAVWEDAGVDCAAVLAERGARFDLLLKGDKQAKRWGVKGTPGLFVLDAAGTVVYDRNAHPYTPPPGSDGKIADRKTGIARSAAAWGDAVAAVVERELARADAAAPTP